MRRLKSVECTVNPAPLLKHNFNLFDGVADLGEVFLEFSAFIEENTFEKIFLKPTTSTSIFMDVRP